MRKPRQIEAADLFCGAGGTSQGLLMAANRLERPLKLMAINHWTVAIDTHTLNHPEAQNLCTGLDAVDPHKLVPSGRLDLLCASPECTHHSIARGGKPMDDQSRSSAWLILRWAQQLYIGAMIFENVPEWQSWGPLGANGKPLKSKKGELFRMFVDALKAMNYKVEWKVLNCADYGSPTTRRRLFMIARRDGKPITWPAESHISPDKAKTPGIFDAPRKPWVTARQIIDWSKPGKSIFGRKKPLADNTLRRIEAGLERFNGIKVDLRKCVREDLRPYLIIPPGGTLKDAEAFLLGQQSGSRPHSMTEPVPTVATAGAVSITQPFLTQIDHASGSGALRGVESPLATLVTKENTALAEPFLTTVGGTEGQGRNPHSVEEPLGTVLTNDRRAIAEPFIIPQFGTAPARSMDRPVGTLTTTSRGVGVAEPFLTVLRGTSTVSDVDAPLPTVTNSGAHYAAVEPFLVNPNFGEREGQAPRVRSIDSPAPAVTSASAGGVVEPFVVTVNHGDSGGTRVRSIDDPMATVTGSMGEAVAAPSLVEFYGSSTVADVNEPVPTVTCKDRFGLMLPELIALGYGVYMLDIHFRMLQPRELARAQGFPDTYQFTGNREAVVKQIGNAVPPDVAAALCYEVLSSMQGATGGKTTLERAA